MPAPSLLLIGLGNPGKAYERTRHNCGFRALDALAEKFATGPWKDAQKFSSTLRETRIAASHVLLVKPQTYMNASGEAVKKLMAFYKLPASAVLVLCDDVDLPCGAVRLREKGSAGTHNGLKSIVEQIGEGFPRLRIGIGPKPEKEDLAAWVLSVPPEKEQTVITTALTRLPDIVEKFVQG